MATLNKPENFKTIEAHDLGQISIKTLRALVNWIESRHEKIADDMLFTNAPHDPQYHYLDGQYDALHDALMFMLNFKAAEPEIREGMTEFVGPPRRVWVWVGRNNGQDPRTMTGGETYRHSGFRRDFHFTIDDLDAPRSIAAGSTRESIIADDPDRNVFPTTIDRDFF